MLSESEILRVTVKLTTLFISVVLATRTRPVSPEVVGQRLTLRVKGHRLPFFVINVNADQHQHRLVGSTYYGPNLHRSTEAVTSLPTEPSIRYSNVSSQRVWRVFHLYELYNEYSESRYRTVDSRFRNPIPTLMHVMQYILANRHRGTWRKLASNHYLEDNISVYASINHGWQYILANTSSEILKAVAHWLERVLLIQAFI